MNYQLMITNEHGVNSIPEKYQRFFEPHQELLKTHRGLDIGSLYMATQLSEHLNCPLFKATASRLLIDCNRKLTNPNCFSSISAAFSAAEKQHIIETYYLPYRLPVETYIAEQLANNKPVLHISVHSFTPILNDVVRNADFAFLYDPRRDKEKRMVDNLHVQLQQRLPTLRIRRNYPYKGISDGFTTALRRLFPENYVGIEFEVNQAITADKERLIGFTKTLVEAVVEHSNVMSSLRDISRGTGGPSPCS